MCGLVMVWCSRSSASGARSDGALQSPLKVTHLGCKTADTHRVRNLNICHRSVSWSYLSHLIHGCLVSDSGFLSTFAIFKCLFTFSCCQWLAGRCIPTQMAAETWCLKCSGIQNNQHWLHYKATGINYTTKHFCHSSGWIAQNVILWCMVLHAKTSARKKAWIIFFLQAQTCCKHRGDFCREQGDCWMDNHSLILHFDSSTTGGQNWLPLRMYVLVIQMRELSWTTLPILKTKVCLCSLPVAPKWCKQAV